LGYLKASAHFGLEASQACGSVPKAWAQSWRPNGAGGVPHGRFEVMDGEVAVGYSDGGRHRDGASRALKTSLRHGVRFDPASTSGVPTDTQATLAAAWIFRQDRG